MAYEVIRKFVSLLSEKKLAILNFGLVLVMLVSILPTSVLALPQKENGDFVTNKLTAEIDLYAERFSDIEIFIRRDIRRDNRSIVPIPVPDESVPTQVKQADSEGKVRFNIPLGTQTDERDGCVETKHNRRTGICEDGIFTVDTFSYDAAGNKSEKSVIKIERDTVKPFVNSVKLSQEISRIKVDIKAEANSEIFVNLESVGFANESGNLSYYQNIVCGVNYQFKVYSKDFAGNFSDEKFESIQTKACGIGGGGEVLGGSNEDPFGGQNGNNLADPNAEVGKLIVDRDSNGKIKKHKYELTNIRGPHITHHTVGFDEQVKFWTINYFPGQNIGKINVEEYTELSDDDPLVNQFRLQCFEFLGFIDYIHFIPVALRNMVNEKIRKCVESKKEANKIYKSSVSDLQVKESTANLYDSDTTKVILSSPDGNAVVDSKLEEFASGTEVSIKGRYVFGIKFDENEFEIKSDYASYLFYLRSQYLEYPGHQEIAEAYVHSKFTILGNSVVIGEKPRTPRQIIFEDAIHPLTPDYCPDFNESRGFLSYHNGIDWAKTGGCIIVAPYDGKIIKQGWGEAGEGYRIYIDHGDGVYTVYLHGDGTFYKSEGDLVRKGESIMYMGNSGNSTGTHLHFSLWIDGEPWIGGTDVNPKDYFLFLK